LKSFLELTIPIFYQLSTHAVAVFLRIVIFRILTILYLLFSPGFIWSGEFGRLPISQNGSGRDHNRNACTTLLAGGGVKGGLSYGATDELGYRSVEKVTTVHDLHATILHQLGLDHNKLTYHHQGHSESLTDTRVTQAKVIHDILT